MTEEVDELINKSYENDGYLMYIREIEFFTLEEMLEKYPIGTVRGISGCDIKVLQLSDWNNCRYSYVEELCKLHKSICIIEESQNKTKICTLDAQHQIPHYFFKAIRQIRFDHFDWHEGYVDFVNVNDLDTNEQCYIDHMSEEDLIEYKKHRNII